MQNESADTVLLGQITGKPSGHDSTEIGVYFASNVIDRLTPEENAHIGEISEEMVRLLATALERIGDEIKAGSHPKLKLNRGKQDA